jgi:hypothetical protein
MVIGLSSLLLMILARMAHLMRLSEVLKPSPTSPLRFHYSAINPDGMSDSLGAGVLYQQEEAHEHRYLIVSETSLWRTYRSGIVDKDTVRRAILQLSDEGEDGALQSHKAFPSVLRRASGHVVARVWARFGVRMAQDTRK